MRASLSGVSIEPALTGIVNTRAKAARNHSRDDVKPGRELPRRIRHRRFIFARDLEDFVRAQLRIERRPLQKIERARAALVRSGEIADGRSIARSGGGSFVR